MDVEEGTLREQLEAVEAEIEGINTKAKELELQVRRTGTRILQGAAPRSDTDLCHLHVATLVMGQPPV